MQLCPEDVASSSPTVKKRVNPFGPVQPLPEFAGTVRIHTLAFEGVSS